MARGRVVKRSEGSWSIVYDLPTGMDGRRQKRESGVPTKKAADAKLTQRLHES